MKMAGCAFGLWRSLLVWSSVEAWSAWQVCLGLLSSRRASMTAVSLHPHSVLLASPSCCRFQKCIEQDLVRCFDHEPRYATCPFGEALKRLDISDLVSEKHNIDEVLQHIGNYYIYGTNVNPLATLVSNFEAALYSVLRFYSLIDWVVDAGALTCPGLENITPKPLVHSFLNSTHTAYDFFHAKNIWPYYHQHLGSTEVRPRATASPHVAVRT